MERYDSYKDSGVDWIGEIPTDWGFEKTKTLCEREKRTISVEEFENQKVIHYSIPNVQEFGTGVEELGEDIDSSKLLFSGGEVLVSKLNPRKGCVTRVRFHNDLMVIGSGEFVPLIPKKNLNPDFFHYFIQSPRYSEFLDSNVESVTRSHQRVSPDIIYDLRVPLPPLSVQKQIVEFLDRKTTLIDSLIEKTEKRIELLKEKRTSLINQVVTKGLNPDVEMKDSGVEWIGKIPGHWEVTKVKYNFVFRGGSTPSTEVEEYWNGDIPWVSSKDVKTKFIHDTEDHVTSLGVMESSCSMVPVDSLIVVVRSGILQRTIPLSINKVELVVNQDQKVMIPGGRTLVPWFYYYVKGNENRLLKTWVKEGTTVESVEMDYLSNHSYGIPPIKEQEQIVKYLDEQTSVIDSKIISERERVELLKEYRQSLISEVVTGKVKV